MADEHARLEGVAEWYSGRTGFYSRLVRYGYEALRPHFAGTSCCELGPADGQMTGMLLEHFDELVSVEGSSTYCDRLREHYAGQPKLEVVCSLFEDYRPGRSFDTVLGTHILEHVDDPVSVLAAAREWGQRLIMLVPNALSIHRLVAVEMGMLERPDSLNELDQRLGHRRVYNPDLLHEHVSEAGWRVRDSGGVFLKPLSNGQIEEWFDDSMMDGFAAAAPHFPRHAAEIYVVAE